MTKQLKKTTTANLPVLTEQNLDAVRILAEEGAREHCIRRALGYTPKEWSALKKEVDDELSPLALALEEGQASGATNIVNFFKLKMSEGDVRSAEWLADKIYKIGKDSNDESQPRVQIILNAPLSREEYDRTVINVQP